MDLANRSSPSCPPSPQPPFRPDKATLQREYRKEEGECFNTLRDVIKNLTGEEPRTRNEILRKASELLLSLSGTRIQSGVQASTLATYEVPTSSPALDCEDTLTHHSSYATPSSHWSQTSQSNTGFEVPVATSYFAGTYFPGQQDQSTSAVDSALRQSTAGNTQDSYNYLRLNDSFTL